MTRLPPAAGPPPLGRAAGRDAPPPEAPRRARASRTRAAPFCSLRSSACRWSSSSRARSARPRRSAPRCDLNALRPVAVGQNSFVYAANGTELGVIPAERNRTPVTRGEISPGCRRRRSRSRTGASTRTAASIRSASSAPSSPTFRRARSSRAARRSRRSSCATSTSRGSGRSSASSSKRASRSSSRASGRRTGSSTAYMNQVYYGNHAYGIEAAAETYFSKHGEGPDARAGGAARRAAAGAVELRPVPQSVGGARAPQRRAEGDAREPRHHVVGVRAREGADESRARAGPALPPHPRAVLLQLRAGAPPAGVRRRTRCAREGCGCTRRSIRGLQRAATAAIRTC